MAGSTKYSQADIDAARAAVNAAGEWAVGGYKTSEKPDILSQSNVTAHESNYANGGANVNNTNDQLKSNGLILTDDEVSTGVIGNTSEITSEDETNSKKNILEEEEPSLIFQVPDWGYKDYIRERTLWQKSYDAVTGEIGWFYFKIFFRFDTNFGLFGGLLKDESDTGSITKTEYKSYDSALKYLNMNKDHYSLLHMEDRANALRKFGATLSYINGHAPWFFDSISGLDKATIVDFKEPMKDREIELGFKEDAVDMRLTNLVDLYKYACFDYMSMKEIVPENLRRFDMIVVLFHTPLRWYHTGMRTMKRGTFPYKSLNAQGAKSMTYSKSDDGTVKTSVSESFPDNRMSYKMYTFKGCEFDLASMGAMYPAEISNKEAFNLGAAKIKIKYKRVYQHTFNEWGRFMIGDDGLYFDNPNGKSKRLTAIKDAKNNPYYYNPSAEIYKPLVDASESHITSAIRQIQPSVLFGNLYLDKTDVNGDYFKNKLRAFKQGANSLHGWDVVTSPLQRASQYALKQKLERVLQHSFKKI